VFGQATYLVFELGWALPVVCLQWAVAGRILWRRRRVWAAAVTLPSLYLWVADDLAIHAGIWHISPHRTSGLVVLGLPIEEAVFFLLTNAMVVQTLLVVPESMGNRVFSWISRVARRPTPPPQVPPATP